MDTRVDWKFGVENTTLDAELFEEKLQPVTAVNVLNENNAFALDKLELEDNVDEEELFVFCASGNC